MTRPTSDARRQGEPLRTHAVVLCMPGQSPPEILVTALQKRRVQPLATDDAFQAMVLLARAGLVDEGRPPALIVVEPSSQNAGPLEELTRVLRRRQPGVALWRFDSNAQPPLRAFSASGFSDHASHSNGAANGDPRVVVAPRGRPSPARPGVPPQLRLTDGPAVHDRPEEAPSALLSEEELAMLLADDFDDLNAR
jgi:hypothetical protein